MKVILKNSGMEISIPENIKKYTIGILQYTHGGVALRDDVSREWVEIDHYDFDEIVVVKNGDYVTDGFIARNFKGETLTMFTW